MILNMLPIHKIYIDSRHKAPSSESDTDFEIQLREAINLPENCTCVVSDVVLKNTITTIESFNENLYVRANNLDRIVKLDHRNFNIKEFGDNVSYKINRAFEIPGSTDPRLVRYLEDVYNTVILLSPTVTNTL